MYWVFCDLAVLFMGCVCCVYGIAFWLLHCTRNAGMLGSFLALLRRER